MALQDENLKETLMQDVAQTESQAKAYSAGTGIAASEDVGQKAKTLSRKTQLEQLLSTSKQTIEDTAQKLTQQANLKDAVEQDKMRAKISKRLNDMRLYLIRQSGEIEKQFARKQIDKEKRAAMLQSLSSVAQSGTAIAISEIGRTPMPGATPEVAAATPRTGPPTLTDGLNFNSNPLSPDLAGPGQPSQFNFPRPQNYDF